MGVDNHLSQGMPIITTASKRESSYHDTLNIRLGPRYRDSNLVRESELVQSLFRAVYQHDITLREPLDCFPQRNWGYQCLIANL